ncbi:MAG: hypothetical protein SFY81_01310 [Verrucomicrobiota bacterium]|nr:hypothetical protein [Verrucomicrobiota bacterium]
MNTNFAAIFWELVRTPFLHVDMIWGIVPLYFGWIVNEITSSKASFKTAIQTGFSFCWAAAHWLYQYSAESEGKLTVTALFAVNIIVTVGVGIAGVTALISGIRRKYPKYCSFLGHSRFSNYFMIAIFPIQSNYLAWSWDRLTAIALFAVPLWVLLHFGLMPVRK